MYNINSHINVIFFQKTTGQSRERSASLIDLLMINMRSEDVIINIKPFVCIIRCFNNYGVYEYMSRLICPLLYNHINLFITINLRKIYQ